MQTKKTESLDLNAHVHPELKETFANLPSLNISRKNLVESRKLLREIFTSFKGKTRTPYDHISITTKHIPGPKDAPEVYVRIYNKSENTQRPALLYIHGGGFILGHPDESDPICQRLAYETDCVVISPDYRLAPEHPFPAAIEDCYSTLVWIKDSAQELGIDVNKIAVAGQSAGGGLCAGLTLLARDRGGPAICFQIPLYPMIDDRNVTPSSQEIVDGRCWNREANIDAWDMYLGENNRKDVSPYAAASRATDFSRLPPTFTFVGSLDVFRDENIEYVTKLLQAGVPTEFHIYPGCFHGFDAFVPDAEVSKHATESFITALKKAFAAKSV